MPAVVIVMALALALAPLRPFIAADVLARVTRGTAGLTQDGPSPSWNANDPGQVALGSALGVAGWMDIITRASDESGVPWQVLAAIMAIESGGDPAARSVAGAIGLMQVMPYYWEAVSQTYGPTLWDPWTNVRTAADILARAQAKWGTWEQAAGAYFGAIDDQGRVTEGRDAYGTSGRQYVERFRITLAAFGMGQSLAGLGAAGNVAASEAIGRGLAYALQQQGVPYVWGGATPNQGFDCSGLIVWSYGLAGLTLPRTAAEMWRATPRVSAADARPGDLVFFAGTNGPGISHVAVYVGERMMVNAPTEGETVQLMSLDDPYWQARLAGFGRVDPSYVPGELAAAIDTGLQPQPQPPAVEPPSTPAPQPVEQPSTSPTPAPTPVSTPPETTPAPTELTPPPTTLEATPSGPSPSPSPSVEPTSAATDPTPVMPEPSPVKPIEPPVGVTPTPTAALTPTPTVTAAPSTPTPDLASDAAAPYRSARNHPGSSPR